MGKIGTPRRIDITGQVFGQLTVLGFDQVIKENSYWKVRCSCGNEQSSRGQDLKNGKIKSCSLECYHKSQAQKHIGEVIGNLTIVETEYIKDNRQYYHKCKARCICGDHITMAYHTLIGRDLKGCSVICDHNQTNQKFLGLRYGRLLATAIGNPGDLTASDAEHLRACLVCQCDCGKTKTVSVKNLNAGMVVSCGCVLTEYEQDRDGVHNPNWKGGVTPTNVAARKTLEYWEWQAAGIKAANYTCMKTGEKIYNGACHHIYNFANYIGLRFDPLNFCYLSKEAHIAFHGLYGRDNNSLEQLEEFIGRRWLSDTNREELISRAAEEEKI